MSLPAGPPGVASTAELVGCGSSRSSLAREAKAGRLVRVARGLYSTTSDPDQLLLASRFGAVSHTTAAALHGFDLLQPAGLHATAVNHRRSPPLQLLVHRGRLGPDDVVRQAGVIVTAPLRTALDCARLLPEADAVVLLDSALRNGTLQVDTLRRVAATAGGPGAARVRRHVAASDASSESALETLARLLFHAHGFLPQTQVVIRDAHGFLARVDFLFDEAALVVETDGFAHHADRTSFRADRQRQNALVRAGFQVLRFGWEDIVGNPGYVIATVRALLGRG